MISAPVNSLKLYMLKHVFLQRQETVLRKLSLRSWEEIKTIGILYSVPEEKDYVRFVSFVGWMQSQKKEVKALGLLKTPQTPHYCYPRIAFDYFSMRNVSLLGKPGGERVHDFTQHEFDLLVNLELGENPLFHYIIRNSHARLKAGKYYPQSASMYDLMINSEEIKDHESLMEHIIVYLDVLREPGDARPEPPPLPVKNKKKKQKSG